jgi:hypothetical protein
VLVRFDVHFNIPQVVFRGIISASEILRLSQNSKFTLCYFIALKLLAICLHISIYNFMTPSFSWLFLMALSMYASNAFRVSSLDFQASGNSHRLVEKHPFGHLILTIQNSRDQFVVLQRFQVATRLPSEILQHLIAQNFRQRIDRLPRCLTARRRRWWWAEAFQVNQLKTRKSEIFLGRKCGATHNSRLDLDVRIYQILKLIQFL